MLRATKAVAAGGMVGGLNPDQPADAPPAAGLRRPIALDPLVGFESWYYNGSGGMPHLADEAPDIDAGA
jgi:hypothetical protein